MTRSSFDLAALREGRPLPRPSEPNLAQTSTADAPPQTHERNGPSRREMLRMLGIGAVLTTSLPKAAEAFAAFGSVRVIGRRNRAAFVVGGQEVFAVDASRFAGTPRVAVRRTADGVTAVRLSGARWPGTSLPADATFTLDPASDLLTIELALGGFATSMRASQWLSGRTVASSRVSAAGHACNLDTRGRLSFGRGGRAQFTPDWRLHIEGRSVASVDALGHVITTDQVTIALLDDADPRLLRTKVSRRSRFTLQRGDLRWNLAPELLPADAGRLHWSSDAIDTVTVETAETGSGRAFRVLLADAPRAGAVSFESPTREFTGSVPLEAFRLAAAFDAAGDQLALVGDASHTNDVRVNGVRVDFSADSEHRQFSAVGSSGRMKLSFSPRIGALRVPFDADMSTPLIMPTDSPVLAQLGTEAPSGFSVLGATAAQIAIPNGATQTVIRPSDLLVLTFRFYNFAVEETAEGRKLVNATFDGNPMLMVEFPPQSFRERAYLWGEPTGTPTKARMSGDPADPSVPGARLAFQIPNYYWPPQGIPYTLEGLLGWGRKDLFSYFSPMIAAQGMTVPLVAGAVPEPSDPRVEATTFVEMPWHLCLTPDEYGRWRHQPFPAKTAVSSSTLNRVPIEYRPLWHTRLWRFAPIQSRASNQHVAAPAPDIRAIWSPEFGEWQAGGRTTDPSEPATPAYPLSKHDLVDLVRVMSDVGTSQDRTPAQARNVMLSSQGGWLDAKGEWDLTTPDLGGWTHKATLGRDHYVRVARKGFLYPFGHRCTRLEVTERKIVKTTLGPRAFLFKQTYLVVKEPVKEFGGDVPLRRRFPFRQVRIVTDRTPSLDTETRTRAAGFGRRSRQSHRRDTRGAGVLPDRVWQAVPFRS